MSDVSYKCLGEDVKTPFGDYVPPGQKPPLTFYVKQGNSGHFDQVVVGTATAYDMPWLWSGHIPLNRVTLIEGPAGAGKSFVVLDLVARFTSDRPWPDGTPQAQPGGKALILNRQDHSADVVSARLKSLGAVHDRFTQVHEFNTADEKTWHHTPRSVLLPLDIPAIDKILELDESIRLVVIDPVSDFCSSKKQLVEALHALNRLAALRQVAIIVTLRANAKFNRDGDLVVKNKFDTDAARCQWCCLPDPEEPGRNLFLPTLMNYSALPAGRTYQLGALQVTWDEATVDPRRPLKSELDCASWMRSVLLEGDLPATEVIRLGQEMGFSPSKIQRTREKAGVKRHKQRVRGKFKSMWSIGKGPVADSLPISDNSNIQVPTNSADQAHTTDDRDDRDDPPEDESDCHPYSDDEMIAAGLGDVVLEERLSKLPAELREILVRRFNERARHKSPEEQAEFIKYVLADCPSEFGLPPELVEAINNPLGVPLAGEEEVEEVERVKGVEKVKEPERGEKGRNEERAKGGREFSSTSSTPSTPSTAAKPLEPYKSLSGKPLDPEMAMDIARLLALFDQEDPPRKNRKPSEDDFVPGAFPATDAEIEDILRGKRHD